MTYYCMLFQLMFNKQVRRFYYFEGFAVIMTNWTLEILLLHIWHGMEGSVYSIAILLIVYKKKSTDLPYQIRFWTVQGE